ncbi:DUF983 domain-containing protein [Maritimibacter sp. UBA3975]|uniref:DUF983 domain-containing protein n=1 Tax=Maritimibacter sp. UBA3975 TaxID=1946833 RepID=UPI000C0A514F|nr:DUF983 domain-containing protein [Maritimibacter sp. UBA3975]MAM62840.1 hypothetical protein [Maritimibacter sp.]|tara:strand:- start:2107 stop:2526 length:420 start_codon:yes stop_codon:yes gene_type:complete
MTATSTAPAPDTGAERPLKPAVWRGWRKKCPHCGTGPLMKSYLKVRDTCTVCGEDLHHQRADDGPAYLTILVVGHLLVPFFHFGFTIFRPDPMVLFSVLAILAVALSLYLLPRFKGLMVGVQWAKRMHGFAPPEARSEA